MIKSAVWFDEIGLLVNDAVTPPGNPLIDSVTGTENPYCAWIETVPCTESPAITASMLGVTCSAKLPAGGGGGPFDDPPPPHEISVRKRQVTQAASRIRESG